jgi:tetratricopeptide (TPR) repeat protein
MPTRGPLARYVDRVRIEIVKLVVLVVITASAFAVTRTFATRTIEVGLEDAATWHTRGQQALATGDVDTAVEAFRRAVSKDRSNRTYGLALADALAKSDQPAQAQPILLSLRETAPEDPDINLELGRLAAASGEMATAVRYYQSALYAPPRSEDGPRQIRLELIQLLLKYGENERALSELIAAVGDLGDVPGRRVLVANLMLQAGDPQRALEQFQQELAVNAQDPEAAVGAGTAAFRLGDFAAATRYLRQAPDTPEVTDMRSTAELVLASDPMATRIRGSERRRRLLANLAHVGKRIEDCSGRLETPDPALADLSKLLADVESRARRFQNDQDVIDDGIAAVFRGEQFLELRCGPLAPLDRALLIIGERRNGGEP